MFVIAILATFVSMGVLFGVIFARVILVVISDWGSSDGAGIEVKHDRSQILGRARWRKPLR